VRRSASVFAEISEQLLATGYLVRFRGEGTSMLPTIADSELVTVAPLRPGDRIVAGDIVLCRRPGGLLAHRVVRIDDGRGALVLRGDAKAACDAPVTRNDILGKVIGVNRDGRVVRLTGTRARLRNAVRVAASRTKRMLVAAIRQ
jgi:signal peptidase I